MMFQSHPIWPKRLALLSLILALVVVMFGAYTRLKDAGLGCPDWPGCYGSVLVPESAEALSDAESLYPSMPVEADKAWIEMIHRYLAGTLGLLVLGLTILAWRYRRIRSAPFKTTFLLAAVIIFQALLGMWTVTLNLLPLVVTGHLLGGMLTVSLIWCVYQGWRQSNVNRFFISSKVKLFSTLALIVLLSQIFLGGWTTSNYAAWACPDFPLCNGRLVPELTIEQAFDFSHPVGPNYLGGVLDHPSRATIHWFHRLGALLTLLVFLGLIANLYKTREKIFKGYARALSIALTLQLLLGVGNIVLHFPLWTAVLHNGFAAILLMLLVRLNYQVHHG